MKYGSIGTDTSTSEVTDISPFGIWILHRGKEYFLGYEEFPWFKELARGRRGNHPQTIEKKARLLLPDLFPHLSRLVATAYSKRPYCLDKFRFLIRVFRVAP